MNNAPAAADSPAPPTPSWKIASTTIAFFTRLSFSAPHDWASASGHRRRDFSNPSGEADMGWFFRQQVSKQGKAFLTENHRAGKATEHHREGKNILRFARSA